MRSLFDLFYPFTELSSKRELRSHTLASQIVLCVRTLTEHICYMKYRLCVLLYQSSLITLRSVCGQSHTFTELASGRELRSHTLASLLYTLRDQVVCLKTPICGPATAMFCTLLRCWWYFLSLVYILAVSCVVFVQNLSTANESWCSSASFIQCAWYLEIRCTYVYYLYNDFSVV